MKRVLWTAVLLGLLASGGATALESIAVSERTHEVRVWPHLSVWEEPAGEPFEPGAVAALPDSAWSRLADENAHLGAGRRAIWARLAVRNDGPVRVLMLVHRQSFVDHVETYRAAGDRWQPVPSLRDAQSDRWFGGVRDPAFRLPLAAGETVSLLLRVQTRSLRRFPLQVATENEFWRDQRRSAMGSGALIVIPLIVCVFLVLLWRMLRAPGLLIVTGLILSEVVGAYWVGGVFYVVAPWIDPRTMGLAGMLSWVLAMSFAFQHVRLFLELPVVLPRVARVFRSMPLLMAIFFIFEVAGIPAGRNLLIISGFVAMAVFLGLSIWRALARQRYAWVYALAWGTYALFLGVTIGNLAGLVAPNLANMLMFSQGSIVSLLFGFAVIGQVRDREESTRAELERLKVARTQEELAEARELARRATADRMRLFAAANHDLRQPLQSLGLYLELLRPEVPPGAGRELLSQMRAAYLSLADFMDGLSALSRLESKAIPVRWAAFPLAELLNQLEAEYGAVAMQKNLDFHLVETRLWVRSDRRLLERILRNLIGNAVRYTERGRVLVGCRRRGEGRIEIQVHDTGRGIPADAQARMFEAFSQLDPGAGQGSGLGLAIVRGLADLLGHPLQLRSRPDKGTMFGVRLQRAAALDEPSDAVDAAVPDLSGLAVLVVDDERDLRLVLARYLLSHGAQVATAEAASSAIMALADWQPDVMVVDYRLGREDGMDCIAQVRERAGRPIPAIVITGDTAPERLDALSRSGLPVLHKPVAPLALLQQIRRVCPSAS